MIAIAISFAVVAVAVRSHLLSVETRIQIAGFVIAAAVCEYIVGPRLGSRSSSFWFASNAMMAVLGLLGHGGISKAYILASNKRTIYSLIKVPLAPQPICALAADR